MPICFQEFCCSNGVVYQKLGRFVNFSASFNTCDRSTFESDWDQYYNPLFNVVYLFEEFIKKQDLTDIKKKNQSEFDACFDKKFLNLSYSLWSEREFAKDQDAIEKSLLAHLPIYLSFIKGKDSDYASGNFPEKFDEPFLKSLITDKVVDAFWKAMTNPDKWLSYRAHSMLVFSYFLNNPELLKLLESHTDKFWWTSQNKWLREVLSELITQGQGFCRKFLKVQIYVSSVDIIMLREHKIASKETRFLERHSDLFESYGTIRFLLMWLQRKQSF